MKSIKNIYKTLLLLCFCTLANNVMAQATKVRPNSAVGERWQWVTSSFSNQWVQNNSINANNAIDLSTTTFAEISNVANRDRLMLSYNSDILVNTNETSIFFLKLGGASEYSNVSVNNLPNIKVTFSRANGTIFKNYDDISVSSPDIKFYSDLIGDKYLIINLNSGLSITDSFRTINIEYNNVGTSSLKIYDAYYSNVFLSCDYLIQTSTYSSSLAVINDAANAVDNSLTSYSRLPAPVLGVISLMGLGSSVSQTFQLPNTITDREVKLTLGLEGGLVSVGLGIEKKLEFYNNNTLVGTKDLDNTLIDLGLLGLLDTSTTNILTIKASPKDTYGNIIPFNKVTLVYKVNVLQLDLLASNSIRIYDFTTIDPDPLVAKVCTKEFIVNGIRQTKFDITTIIPNYDTATAYTITNADNQVIDVSNVNNRWQPLGSYTIKGITNSTEYCANETVALLAVQDTSNRLTGKTSIALKLDTSTLNTSQHTFLASDYQILTNDSPVVNVTNQYTINIYNENTLDTVTGTTVVFDKVGTYNYFVKAIKGDCEIVKRITVYVYDEDGCDYRYVQNTASRETDGTVSLLGIPLGGTSESARAVDTDLSTHGSVFNLISLLGIGTTYQNLYFTNGADTSTNKIITAGTPVTIKLGQDFGVAQVIGGITVQALDNAGARIGRLLSIGETDLLNVLAGDNVFEYTFVPRNAAGVPIDYSGVRINLGSVLGVGNNLEVYGAYIDERKSLAEAGICEDNIVINGAEVGPASNQQDVRLRLNRTTKDVLYGTQDIGLGVATALSSVVYPYLAADAIDSPTSEFHGLPDYSTGALFNTSVSALNRMTLTVKFKDIARPGDKVRVVLGKEDASILDLNVLGGALTAQRYMGNVAIGDPIVIQANAIIDLDLLGLFGSNGFNKSIVELPGIGAPFDRVEIGVNSLVNVDLLAPKLRVYDVSVVPYFEFNSDTTEETTLLCTSAPFEVEKLDPCFTYELSYAKLDSTTGVKYVDIPNSTVQNVRDTEDIAQYKLTMNSLIAEANNAGELYLKVVTRRVGCIYGDAKYLKVRVAACGAISNPMIRTRLKAN